MIFDANKISCKKCGSSDIRALEIETRAMRIREWQLHKGQLLIYNYEPDDFELNGPVIWCSDCYELDGEMNDFLLDETLEYLNIKEEEE